jgi:pimeloyl-ACP methyl ester carboxylesterase
MSRRQAQFQKVLEEILPENLEELLKETLDSALSSAKGASKAAKREGSKLEAISREALESMDRDKLEKWVREAVRSLDSDKLEKWARNSLRSVDADKLSRLLRSGLAGLDKDKLEGLLKESVRNIDRRKLEENLRRRVRSVDLEKLKSAARTGLAELDPHKVEDFINTRVDNVVRARLDALSEDDLEKLLASKRAEVKVKGRKGKVTKRDAGVTVKVENEGANPIAGLFGTLGRFAFLGAAGWIAYSHLFMEHQVPLPKAIAAELLTLVYRPSGPLNVYQDRSGSGRPLVLIHSINAAASAYEMRPLFQHYRGKRPVYALDLPGFGFSARPDIEYSPEVYVNAIITMLEGADIGQADVVALSLSSEFAAEAARRRPELFHSLTLISPTGMYRRGGEGSSQASASSGVDKFAYPLLSFRLWARPFYDLLTTKRVISWYLQRNFVGSIPDGMVDYSVATSHQPGAEHAPLYFVSGKLFTPNAFDKIYRQISTPTLVIYDQDPYVRFDRLPELIASNKAWQATRISPTLGLPHWEKTEETVQALEHFWQSVAEPV